MAPMQSVLLKPGVDVEQTLALNEAGISQSQLIRTKNGLTQTIGGWQQFGPTTVPSTVRSLHVWQDISANDYASAAATAQVVAMQSSAFKDITPQERDSTLAPTILSISSGSNVVTVTDPNSGLSRGDAVVFDTPISIGNLMLMGAYPINTIISTGSFTVQSSVTASTTIASSGTLPTFTTVANSALVTVVQSNNTIAPILGLQQSFNHPTSVGGLTIQGPYNVWSVIDSTTYVIVSPTIASSVNTVTMNGGNAHLHYYITNSALGSAGGWGTGPYGGGGYGLGVASSGFPGTPITSTDWTQDNWGEILLAVQADGPVFQWSPSLGFSNMGLVSQAPQKNGGGFVSMPQQILVLWKSEQTQGNGGFNNGGTQDPLIVRWSDAQDFTTWDVRTDTAAGSFHIPTGSVIRGGLQAPNYGVIWTDIDCWIMQLTGDPTSVFNFTKAGSGCGLIGKHAAGVIAGDVFWCGEDNFFGLSGGGVQTLPCTVWDFIFQGKNDSQDHKIVCAPNSSFNEIAWYFCYADATENNAYVKLNIVDKTWDYGFLGRTAWKDVSVIGEPIGSDTGATIYQHEVGNMINGAGNSFFRSGWWTISDGQDMAFIDWFHPDFQWGTYGNSDASVQLQFFSVDYPGDTPRTYGPYTVTQANPYITPRIRGRLVAFEVISATNNVFWRLGRCRYRWGPAGRR